MQNGTITSNTSERALCAVYAIQDAIAGNEILRAHPVIEEWGGTVPAIIIYAFVRRANQDADPVYQSNTTSFFRADQIHNALRLLGRDLGYETLGFGVVQTLKQVSPNLLRHGPKDSNCNIDLSWPPRNFILVT